MSALAGDVQSRQSIWSRIGRGAMTVLLFVAIGPPVGAMFFMMLVALSGLGRNADLAGLLWIGLFSLIYAVPLSYLFGALPAAASGVLVGLKRDLTGHAGWRFAVVAGTAVGIGLLVVSGQPIKATAGEGEAWPPSNLILAATCLFSTLVCWSIERTLHPR